MYSLELDTDQNNHESPDSYFSYVEEKINRDLETRAVVVEPFTGEGIIVATFLEIAPSI